MQPLETGCGSQHPLRALGGTRVLLAAAPTTPPCFRRWRRSSSLLLRGGWSPEVGRGESEHPSLPLAQRSVLARLRQAGTSPAERGIFRFSFGVKREHFPAARILNRSPRQPAQLLHGKAGLQGAVDAARQQRRAMGDDAVQRAGGNHKVCPLLRLHQGGDARRHHRHA